MLSFAPAFFQDQATPADCNNSTRQEQELEQLARAGDRQALLELYTVLQKYILQRARRYMRNYRDVLPPYIEAQDLAQEACLVMYQKLDEAPTKDRPLAYLLGVGYAEIRYAWLRAMRTPRQTSLDRPRSEQDPRPLHEFIPAPPSSAVADTSDDSRASLLAEAVSRLPSDQRVVLAHRLGLDDQVTGSFQEISSWLQLPPSSLLSKERKAYATLLYQLASFFPQYTERVKLLEHAYVELLAQGTSLNAPTLAQAAGVSREEAVVFLYERENAPCQAYSDILHQDAWRRLEQAYNELQGQGKIVHVKALARLAGAGGKAAQRYLLEREGGPRPTVQQRLEQAYNQMQAHGQMILVSELARQARTQRKQAREFLRARGGEQGITSQQLAHQDAWRKLELACAELKAQQKPLSVNGLARQAGTSRQTARMYVRANQVG